MGHLRIVIKMLNRKVISSKVERIILAAVFLFALGLRLIYIIGIQELNDPPAYDGISYDMLAVNLISGRGYALGTEPTAFRPPGYPFLLASLYILLGPHYGVVRMIHALLGALTPLIIYYAVKKVWQWRTALLASLGIAAHPLLIHLTSMIYAETIILLLISLFLFVTMKASSPSLGRDTALIGLILGVLVLMRPSALVLGGMMILWALAIYGLRIRALAAYLIIVICMLLLILPWSLRNYIVFDEFIWMSTNGGVTFWAGNHPWSQGGWVQPGPTTWLGSNPPDNLHGWPGISETESEDRFQRAALEWIGQHPRQFVNLLPKKFVRAWSLNFGNEVRELALPTAIKMLYLLFLGTSLGGMLLSLRRWRDSLTLYFLIANVSLMSLLFYGSTRQSAVAIPAIVIFAALCLDRLMSVGLSKAVSLVTPAIQRDGHIIASG